MSRIMPRAPLAFEYNLIQLRVSTSQEINDVNPKEPLRIPGSICGWLWKQYKTNQTTDKLLVRSHLCLE
jgi:hypothetical protein